MRPLFLLVALLPALAAAQTPGARVTGRVLDAPEGAPLPGATVLATRLDADSLRSGVAADAEGRFALALAPGAYRLRVSFVGYAPDVREVEVAATDVALGEVGLAPLELDEVTVDAVRQRVEVRGDTTVFDAAAYAVHPNANVEDLVAKMPGVVVQDGEVQAQGERVQRVLVDGEAFFGSDPSVALRNLPAEIVQEIQIYDREDDEAELAGEGGQRTLNVVTRPDRRTGQFGRVFAGGGGDTDDARYSAGGALHRFGGSRRISVVGIANNVSEQTFASEDLVAMSGGGGRGGFRERRGGPGGRGGGGVDVAPPLVNARPGVTTTTALAANVQDRFGESVRVQGSYQLNRTGTLTDASASRDYLVGDGLSYTEGSDADDATWSHRLNGRLEANLSDATRLTVRPSLSVQTYDAQALLSGQSTVGDALAGLSRNASRSASAAATGSLTLYLSHRFATPQRSLALGLDGALDGRSADTDQDVLTVAYADGLADTTGLYQRQVDAADASRRLGGTLRYTEPLGERLRLQLSYAPSLELASDDAEAFRLDPATGRFTAVDSSLTSAGEQRVARQRGGVELGYRTERVRLEAGVDAEVEWLDYEQTGPRPFAVDRRTASLLPSARARVEITERTDLDLRYQARTRTPGVTQLRGVIDDTNALLVTAGNPDLATAREHTLRLQARSARPETGSVLFGMVELAATTDYIGQQVIVAEDGPVTVRGVTLAPGAQFTAPANLDGYRRARAFGTVGRPVSLLKSNANATLGATYTRQPSLYNSVLNRADALALDGRLSLGTAASERFDASLSYGLAWTAVANSSRSSADDTYLRHRANATLTWLPGAGLTVSSDFAFSAITGLDTRTAPTTAVWNASLGYALGAAEVRFGLNDLLNRDATIGQQVTDTYVETSQSQALGRHVMLGVTYRIRAFGGAGQIPAPDEGRRRGRRDGDGPPRGRRGGPDDE